LLRQPYVLKNADNFAQKPAKTFVGESNRHIANGLTIYRHVFAIGWFQSYSVYGTDTVHRLKDISINGYKKDTAANLFGKKASKRTSRIKHYQKTTH